MQAQAASKTNKQLDLFPGDFVPELTPEIENHKDVIYVSYKIRLLISTVTG